ncbi:MULTISPECIES: uroporphyrinogen-III C-methyltransferase [unclassified Spirosoma]|uniref:uroporphyrinogen-III C-methyltransferase n=1 Tax=unclassified Spirosoma TaxID=2621999 RepID=UPI00096609C2|nr:MULTISPECIES: uroporphyrinogen-III C-methyltransferase [unclassified Spirosoma]MBN8826538.1 uroporphyrinogen-III C-methyltransferase [Spirosoma sp.]OJW71607.1 MAG: uroporphyrinogen-III C-methyltransferase [Spirosoma sp. 48-14]
MKLTLVGAGPGDPDLITVKGIKVLRQADVVMYDALVHPDLLDYCRPDTLKVYVGKRRGAYSCMQEDINPLIVHYARQYGHVVRLKGGDSFVFGRGYEEIEFARQHGINTEVVPGLSSSYAVPASAGVPLTTRGLSESFWVVTGTTKDGQFSNDLQLAAQSTATVVVLMGMHKLAQIMAVFTDCGQSDTPVAIIQNGTLPEQQVVIGRVSDIVQKTEEAGVGNPAIIVVGEVAKLAISDLVALSQTSDQDNP